MQWKVYRCIRIAKDAGWRGISISRGFLAAILLNACTVQPPVSLPSSFPAGSFEQFVVEHPLLPFKAEGAIMVSYQGKRESGELRLTAVEGQQIGMQVHARFTGGLVLDVRFDLDRLQVLDYVGEAYYMGPNVSETRSSLFELDLTTQEFLIALTGRVPRSWLDQRRGMPLAGKRYVAEEADALHLFWLGPEGLPTRWVKQSRQGETLFRVEYLTYGNQAAPGTTPLLLPRKLRVYLADEVPRLVLGIRRFTPGVPLQDPLLLEALPEAAREFSPIVLP